MAVPLRFCMGSKCHTMQVNVRSLKWVGHSVGSVSTLVETCMHAYYSSVWGRSKMRYLMASENMQAGTRKEQGTRALPGTREQ